MQGCCLSCKLSLAFYTRFLFILQIVIGCFEQLAGYRIVSQNRGGYLGGQFRVPRLQKFGSRSCAEECSLFFAALLPLGATATASCFARLQPQLHENLWPSASGLCQPALEAQREDTPPRAHHQCCQGLSTMLLVLHAFGTTLARLLILVVVHRGSTPSTT